MLQTGYLISNIKSPVWSQRNAPAATDSGWLTLWLWLHHGYTVLPRLTVSQQKRSKYYFSWSGPSLACWAGKVKFTSFLVRLTGTLAHIGQRGRGEGDIWAISKSICIFGDICWDILIPGVESGACWEQERLAAPPSPVCVPSERIRKFLGKQVCVASQY